MDLFSGVSAAASEDKVGPGPAQEEPRRAEEEPRRTSGEPQPAVTGLPAPRVWSVREVNLAAQRLLEQSLPRMWVSGEVANFGRHRSGHCYFTLKDRAAQIRCALFAREADRLPMLPRDGMTVQVFGYLTVYGVRGTYQLVASKVEAQSEGGMWKLAFERLKNRLDAEGLTSTARKRPLPAFPRTVGVVTSPGSAALRDVVAVVGRRAPWVRLVVGAAKVQGEGASREVASAVAALGDADVDVIVVARGGGSVEDLWAFNEEPVARAVAASPVPVVSGVGHETDVTICDLVADLRAATPSAAAEAVVPEREEVERLIDQYARRLGIALAQRARSRRDRLERAEGAIFRRVRRLGPVRRDRLERGRTAMAGAVRRRIRRDAARLAGASAAMEALSPLSTLARGYAVPLDGEGRLLRGVAEFEPELAFRLRVVDGSVPCKVTGRAP